MTTSIKVIITGATGMVGEGVLHECLHHPSVSSVLVINRKPCGVVHAKLTEIIHADFYDLSAIENQLTGYNACFFCLGVSSVGMNEVDYTKVTYTLTMHFAQTLVKLNPDMTFCYISGASTDSTEKGRQMWARVKGKTENDLMKLPFKKAYAFRPGFILPIKGMKRAHHFYKYISWLFPVGRALYAKGFCKLTELGAAMIYTAQNNYATNIIEGGDIIAIAKLKGE